MAATAAIGLFGVSLARAARSPLSMAASATWRVPNVLFNRVVRAGPRLVGVGEHGIAVWSDDHGVSWHQARVPVSVTLTSVFFVTESLGWATGHGGVILNTEDGGKIWQRQLDGGQFAQAALKRAQDLSSGDGEAQQNLRDAERLVEDGADKPFLALYFLDARHGMAVGAYGIAARTSDGGRNWTPCLEILDNPDGMHLYAIARAADCWVVAGEQGFLAQSHSRTGSFRRIDTPGGGSFFTLANVRPNSVLAAGLLGNASWLDVDSRQLTPCDLPDKATVLSATVLQSSLIVLVEAGGGLLVSKDRGQSFSWSEAARTGPMTSIVETPNGSLVAAGPAGMRLLSMDEVVLSGQGPDARCAADSIELQVCSGQSRVGDKS